MIKWGECKEEEIIEKEKWRMEKTDNWIVQVIRKHAE